MGSKITKWLSSLLQNQKMIEQYSNQKMTEHYINEE
jgi:hypothetical protein